MPRQALKAPIFCRVFAPIILIYGAGVKKKARNSTRRIACRACPITSEGRSSVGSVVKAVNAHLCRRKKGVTSELALTFQDRVRAVRPGERSFIGPFFRSGAAAPARSLEPANADRH